MSRKTKKETSFYRSLKGTGKKYCPQCETIYDVEVFRAGFCIECSKAFSRKQYANDPSKAAERYKRRRRANDYYVYKFLDKDDKVIYVGKSKQIKNRMVQHFRTDGHLSDECYDNVRSVFYCQLKTKIEMDIYEIYLIDKYRPRFNTLFIYESNEISNITLPDLDWHEYSLDGIKVG